MNIQFFTKLPPEEIEALWKQGVILEDWDYLLIVPEEEMIEYTDMETDWYTRERFEVNNVSARCWLLDNLLNGPSHNKWHIAEFRGKKVGIGVAYHG